MELVEVVALAHFEDTRIGAVSTKQRTRIPKPIAEQLIGLGLVKYANPTQAVVKEPVKTEVAVDGGDEPLESLPQGQALPEPIATFSRRGRPSRNAK